MERESNSKEEAFRQRFSSDNDHVAFLRRSPDGTVDKRVVLGSFVPDIQLTYHAGSAGEILWDNFFTNLAWFLRSPESPWCSSDFVREEGEGFDEYIQRCINFENDLYAPLSGPHIYADGVQGTWTMPLEAAWNYIVFHEKIPESRQAEYKRMVERALLEIMQELPHVETPRELPRLAVYI